MNLSDLINQTSGIMIGKVISINSEGSYDVLIRGRSTPASGIHSHIKCKVGDIVNLIRVGGDSQKIQILSFSNYKI